MMIPPRYSWYNPPKLLAECRFALNTSESKFCVIDQHADVEDTNDFYRPSCAVVFISLLSGLATNERLFICI